MHCWFLYLHLSVSFISLFVCFNTHLYCLFAFILYPVLEHTLQLKTGSLAFQHFRLVLAAYWNFLILANLVYSTENLSYSFLLIFDENLTDFIPHILRNKIVKTIINKIVKTNFYRINHTIFFSVRVSFTDTDNSQDSWGREGTFFYYFTLPLPLVHEHSDTYVQLCT